MRFTNEILIHRKSRNGQPDEAPTEENANPLVKRKSFAPADIDITPYHQLQRVPPDKIPEIERNTNIIKEYLSKKGAYLGFFDRKHTT